MTTELITSERLYQAIMAGAKETIKQSDHINKLNVFPVADNDTGTNLSITMRTIMEEAKVAETPKQTMASIVEAALTGARGKSGLIFAQFLNGIHAGLVEDEEISLADFSKAVNSGVYHAYESLSNPMEGTIITVMHDWSESINRLKDSVVDVTELFIKSLESAVDSINTATERLLELKNASVVDAGGKGFVYFLEGMTAYFISAKHIN